MRNTDHGRVGIPLTRNQPCKNGKGHFTEDLLSRTVFYKVSHHLSHHGTAERLGMAMLTHPDLAAMATLDYHVISANWQNTMPNRALLRDLLKQTRGRLMVMNAGRYATPGLRAGRPPREHTCGDVKFALYFDGWTIIILVGRTQLTVLIIALAIG